MSASHAQSQFDDSDTVKSRLALVFDYAGFAPGHGQFSSISQFFTQNSGKTVYPSVVRQWLVNGSIPRNLDDLVDLLVSSGRFVFNMSSEAIVEWVRNGGANPFHDDVVNDTPTEIPEFFDVKAFGVVYKVFYECYDELALEQQDFDRFKIESCLKALLREMNANKTIDKAFTKGVIQGIQAMDGNNRA